MKRAHVLVEGQTEETFVQGVLRPHLLQQEIELTPVLVATKRLKSGGKFKGGITDYGKVRNDLLRLLGDTSADLVTTMMDFYGLPADFPGMRTLPRRAASSERADHLEAALRADLGHGRFFPYLSLHEFEALLFTAPAEVDVTFPGCRKALEEICSRVASPEEINDGKETHPAARLARLIPTYRKPLHGPTISGRIGLPSLRARCPHFNDWVTRLERLKPT